MVIAGVGWYVDGMYGRCDAPANGGETEDASLYSQLRADGILSGPMQDFGRLSPLAKQTCAAVGASLRDAGILDKGRDETTGIVGNTSALDANVSFFTDYVDNGRTLARGSLFVHTLPSSPLAGAALCYGLTGPITHIRQVGDAPGPIVGRAAEMLEWGMADAMVATCQDATGVLSCVIFKSGRKPERARPPLKDLLAGTPGALRVAEIVGDLLGQAGGAA